MAVLDQAKKEIVELLKTALGVKTLKESDLVFPPSSELGDLSFPCFGLAKVMKKTSREVASEIHKKIKPIGLIDRIEFAGPYLNFFLDREKVAEAILVGRGLVPRRGVGPNAPEQSSVRGRQAPTLQLGRGLRGQRILIEYVSPNNNKPLHLGHLRNAFLGESVARLLESQGAKVIRACLFNDRGLHIAKSMLAYQKWGRGKTPAKQKVKGDKFVGGLYVEFEKAAQEEQNNVGRGLVPRRGGGQAPALLEDAEEIVRLWEQGDKKTRALWQKLSNWTMDGFSETLKRLKIKFDKSYFESKLWEKGKGLVAKGLEQKVFEKDQTGAVIVNLEKFNLPPKVMLRADGTAIYSTTDLALGKEKFSSRGGSAFGGEKNKLTQAIWCVGSEQDLYLKQLFAIYKIFGFPWFEKCQHLSYGLVFLPEGKMKSREGKVVEADDLMDELQSLALKEILQRHPPLTRGGVGGVLKKRAEIIAQAALRFYLLSVTPKTIVHFNPQESISFTGRTGPYLLYTYARMASILRKAPSPYSSPLRGEGWGEGKVMITDPEWHLIFKLAQFSEVVRLATEQSDPSHLAQYLYDLSKSFSDFYENSPVLQAEPRVRQARLALIGAVKNILSEGLRLLTIETVEEM